jgi:Zn-dependent peptidase ImmA (M78 family)
MVEMDVTVFSKIENGKRAIKSTELSRIADALQVSPLALLEDEPVLSDLPLAARLAGRSIARGDAYQRLLRLSELHVVLADGGIPTSPNLWGVPPVAGKSWLEAGQALADWARAKLPLDPKLADLRLGTLASLIESELRVDVLIERYADDPLCGAAITGRSFPLIFVNGYFPRPRSLFTLAHELGHVLAAHSDEAVTLDRDLSGSNDSERLANVFAANYLMPKDVIDRELHDRGRRMSTVIRLTHDLGVSYESMIYRLHNLGIINAEGRDAFRAIGWQQLSAQLGDHHLAGELTKDQIGRLQSRSSRLPADHTPVLLLQRAYAGYSKGVVSARPVADLEGVDAEQLIEQLGKDADIMSVVDDVDAASYGVPDSEETVEELFSGSPV